MSTTRRPLLASRRDDASKLVERATRFSVRVPVVGPVSARSPEQLAFYAALGILATVNVIDGRSRWQSVLAQPWRPVTSIIGRLADVKTAPIGKRSRALKKQPTSAQDTEKACTQEGPGDSHPQRGEIGQRMKRLRGRWAALQSSSRIWGTRRRRSAASAPQQTKLSIAIVLGRH
jgi:hypothetical protein